MKKLDKPNARCYIDRMRTEQQLKLERAERVLHYHLEDCAYCNTPPRQKVDPFCGKYYELAAKVTGARKEAYAPDNTGSL